MHIALITREGEAHTGLGRYTHELAHSLRALGHEVTLVIPVLPLPAWLVRFVLHRLGVDLRVFFNDSPVWASYPAADLYHITSQNLATLMLFRRPPGKTVVTVHDIIPFDVQHDPALNLYRHVFDRMADRIALWGVQRSDAVLAVSHHTRSRLIACLGLPPERVHVTPEGVRAG